MTRDTLTKEIAAAILASVAIAQQSKGSSQESDGSSKAKLFSLIARALARTEATFTETYPELGTFVFSEIGIKPLASELARLISGQGEPNPSLIADAWAGLMPLATQKSQALDLERAARTLIQQLKQELATEPEIELLLEELSAINSPIARGATQGQRPSISRGEAFLRMGEHKSALDEFNRVLAGDPTNEIAMNMRRTALNLLEQRSTNKEDRILTNILLEAYPTSLPYELTPEYLDTKINPYLIAIANIQSVIDDIQNHGSSKVLIKAITQNSPISVSLEGASQAIQTINDSVVPWRRKHVQTMAQLSEQEKMVEIESKQAEVLEKRAHAQRERLEGGKQREEIEKLRLENEMLRIQLHRTKIELALEVLNSIASNLSEADRIAYLIRLLPPLDFVATSELNIAIKT